MKKEKSYSFIAKILNPLVLIIYGILCFYLYSLSQYGGVKRKVPIIISSAVLLLLWFLLCYYKRCKNTKVIEENKENIELTKRISSKHKKILFSKLWFFIACFILIATTFITSMKIYQSAVSNNGKLSWFIEDLKNKRQISFVHNNIYENDIEGIFDEIESKINLPQDLYISTDFRLKFSKDGTITSFDTYVYGKDEKGQTESFLISYDTNKSKKIIVYLNGFVAAEFNEEKKLQPLIEIMKWVPLEDTVFPWNDDQFGIIYSGLRNWGYSTEGIQYVNEDGSICRKDNPLREILGYTVSVYTPGKEDLYSPARFIYESENSLPEESPTVDADHNNEWEIGYNYNKGKETFFINEKLGYQLSVVDSALGSRFYALLQSKDGGESWKTINKDPYLNHTGVSAGITFINESLGFIALSHSGGIHAELYRTTDGGLSYEEISLPTIEVPLIEDQVQEPFDFSEMPYEEDGKILILVGQGQDGDYKSGIRALYQSEDQGKTWTFVREK